MRITTKGRYAVRALLDLALFYERGPVNLQNICQRQHISADYLEQILRRLRNAGLVRSVRGPRGGFMLAKPPDQITVWQIVSLLSEPLDPAPCVDSCHKKKRCDRLDHCAAHVLWDDLHKHIADFLSKRTLRDLCDSARQLLNRASPDHPHMFHI
ncbi:MAG TPA: Rrf2 family transcriptional regulator [Candidatus Brocadiia bacterium]|nr:Rrf2 family transcriptional regulator [Candidatus Brocadiia bacterium]